MTECRAIVNRAYRHEVHVRICSTLRYLRPGTVRAGARSGVRRHDDDDNDPGQLETRPISADRAPDPMAEASLKTATRASPECLQVQNENIRAQIRRCNARVPTTNIRYERLSAQAALA